MTDTPPIVSKPAKEPAPAPPSDAEAEAKPAPTPKPRPKPATPAPAPEPTLEPQPDVSAEPAIATEPEAGSPEPLVAPTPLVQPAPDEDFDAELVRPRDVNSTAHKLIIAMVALAGFVGLFLAWHFDVLHRWFFPSGRGGHTSTWAYPGLMVAWLVVCWCAFSMAIRAVTHGELTFTQALSEIVRDNWNWRQQARHLAVTDLVKESRGAVLGWVWFIIRPATFIGMFWFGIAIGLRAATPPRNGYPFLLWLAVGLIAWFFMSDMINGGMNVYRRYSYLVNRVRFPLSVISTVYAVARFIVYAMSMAAVLIAMLVFHLPITIYAVQLPFLALLMLIFWIGWSIMTAPLAALSKDFYNLIRALTMLVFWLSGTIFDVSRIGSVAIRDTLSFNPITFFVSASRAALLDRYWIWTAPTVLLPFLIISVIMGALALRAYARMNREVPDVL